MTKKETEVLTLLEEIEKLLPGSYDQATPESLRAALQHMVVSKVTAARERLAR